jgi:hypothetical protein
MAVNLEAYDALLEQGCGEKPDMEHLGSLIDQAQTFLCRLGDARTLNPIEVALLAAVAGVVRSGSPAPRPPAQKPEETPKPQKKERVPV